MCSCFAAVFIDQDVAVAPVLQGATQELERQLKADQVARQLRHRPAVTELETRGIIDGEEVAVVIGLE